MPKTILIVGAFDSKGEEYHFVRELILARNHQVLAMNTGVMGSTEFFPVDIESDEVAKAAGKNIQDLREKKDRGLAVPIMCEGATILVKKLYDEKRIDGVFGMGGGGGTAMATAAMQGLPIGFPKLCVSTMAATDTSSWIGTRDITMMPSIVDVAGLNQISKKIFTQAVGAICGMVETEYSSDSTDQPIIAASMFGNTTQSVDQCREILTSKGFEVLVFHATGTGGKLMESLVEDGLIDAVLDITTTEWADEICGGLLSAGDTRLDAPGKAKIPHLIVPGCIDMCNYSGMATVPEKYKNRLFYEWNPSVTLMRTTIEENQRMGEIFAEKANRALGPVAFLIPLQGYSVVDSVNEKGEPGIFWNPEADQAFVKGLKSKLRSDIPIIEIDHNINDQAFSEKATEILHEMITHN